MKINVVLIMKSAMKLGRLLINLSIIYQRILLINPKENLSDVQSKTKAKVLMVVFSVL